VPTNALVRIAAYVTLEPGVQMPAHLPKLDSKLEYAKLENGGAPMNLQPLEDRIVVRPAEAEETTHSGLVIPDTAKEKPQQGEVLAIGPGRRAENSGELIPIDLTVGDTVVYSKYGGTEITVDGEDLLILSSRDVLAKQTGKKKK
jgi:chaperonin GroES